MGRASIQKQSEDALLAQYHLNPQETGQPVKYIYYGAPGGYRYAVGIEGYGAASETQIRNITESTYAPELTKESQAALKSGALSYTPEQPITPVPKTIPEQFTIQPAWKTTSQSLTMGQTQSSQPISYVSTKQGVVPSSEYVSSWNKTQSPEIKQSVIPSASLITGSAIGIQKNAYDTQVNNLYQENIKLSGVNVKYGIGDNVKGFSGWDIVLGGRMTAYESGKKEIYVNKLLDIPKGETVGHEYGHYITSDIKDFTPFKKSGSSPLDFINNLGYTKEQVGEEYAARSFLKYVESPTSFKKSYPEAASIFEQKLGYNPLSIKPVSNNISGGTSTSFRLEEKPASLKFDFESLRVGARNTLSNVGGFVSELTYAPMGWAALTPSEEAGIRAKTPSILEPFMLSRAAREKLGVQATELSSMNLEIEKQRDLGIEPTNLINQYQSKYYTYETGRKSMVSIANIPQGFERKALETTAVIGNIAYTPIGGLATVGSWTLSTNKELISSFQDIGKSFAEHPVRSTAITIGGLGLSFALTKGLGTKSTTEIKMPETSIIASQQLRLTPNDYLTRTYASTKFKGKIFESDIASYTKVTGIETSGLTKSSSIVESITRPKAYSSGSEFDLITKGYIKYPVEYSQTSIKELPVSKISGIDVFKQGQVTSGFSFGRSLFKSEISKITSPSYVESSALKLSQANELSTYGIRGKAITPERTGIITLETPSAKNLNLIFKTGKGTSKEFKGGMQVLNLKQPDILRTFTSSGRKSSEGLYAPDIIKPSITGKAITPSSTIGALSDISKSVSNMPVSKGLSVGKLSYTGGIQIGGIQKLAMPKTKLMQMPSAAQVQIIIPKQMRPQVTITKMAQPQMQSLKIMQTQMQIPQIAQPQMQMPRQAQQQLQVSRLAQPSMNIPSIGTPSLFPSTPFAGIPFIALPKLGSFDFGSLGKGNKYGKQLTKYTPSYSAFVFGVKGKAPKGLESGTRLRPITKGFNWRKLFKIK